MNRVLAVAVALGVAALALPAQADWDRPGWGHRHHHHQHYRGGNTLSFYYGPPMVVYRTPPTVYMMAPPPLQAVPVSPMFTDGYGRYCREYQSSMMVGGMVQQGYGTACLMPDGSWRTVN